jgi:Protein of unknown function (DUF1236)
MTMNLRMSRVVFVVVSALSVGLLAEPPAALGRGYEFILVNDQIIVVDPRTFEIVAVLDA